MSTGYLDEADRCDQVAYLYRGRIRTQGTPQEIKAQFPWKVFRLLGDPRPDITELLRGASWVHRVRIVGETITVETALPQPAIQAAMHELHGDGLVVEPVMPTLEMVFTELTEQAEKEVMSNE
jgi:ABC-2 type transport system ATP-binding protein